MLEPAWIWKQWVKRSGQNCRVQIWMGGKSLNLHFVHHSGHQANGLSWLLCNAMNSAMPQKAYFSGLEFSAVWCGAVSHEERICFSPQFHGNPFSKGLGMLFCETFWKVGPTFWTVSITYANSSTGAPIGCTTSGPCDLYDSIQSPPHTHKSKDKRSLEQLNTGALPLQLVHCTNDQAR